jgi:hypothetical protein
MTTPRRDIIAFQTTVEPSPASTSSWSMPVTCYWPTVNGQRISTKPVQSPIALDNEIWALSELFPVSTIHRRRIPDAAGTGVGR